jgi:RDD family
MISGKAAAKAASARPASDAFASIFRRSLAWIVDVVLVTALVFGGVSIVDAALGPAVSFRPAAATLSDTVVVDKGDVAVEALFATVLSAAYFVIPWALLGASPAQLALRIRVRGDAGGETLPVGRAIARWMLLFPPFATISALAAGVPLLGWFVWGSALAWYVVLLLSTARSASNQGLHDRISGTVVQKSRTAVG